MIHIAICDDEKILCNLLKEQIAIHLNALQTSFHISIFQTPSELYHALENSATTFDLIFLDLEFNDPEEDGIIWAKKIRDTYPNTLLIILTAFEERYKEGYVARAFRFMTKPIDEQELAANLHAVIWQLQAEQRICITSNGKTKNISSNQILYMSAHSGGSDIHTAKSTHFNEESLLYWENFLSAQSFFRIHKKYLINLSQVKEITNHNVIMSNDEKLPVSRRKWTTLRNVYMKFDVQNHTV